MTCRITPSVTLESKEPGFSALLSLVFVGLGQAYNGQFLRGVLFLVGTLIGGLSFAPAGAAVWLYGAYDAYAVARRMNGGKVPYRESSVAAVLLFLAVWLVGLLFLPVAPATVSTLTSGLSWW
jgi:TM2 domain-containing membrane protein YozV